MWPIDFFEKIYYWMFPGEYRKKCALEEQIRKEAVRKSKADLLLEYEELLAKVEKMIAGLRSESDRLREFATKIDWVTDKKSLERRFKGTSAKSIIESFDISRLGKYDEIKQEAVVCENTLIRIFVVRQKLKLLGIDRGVKEKHDPEIY